MAAVATVAVVSAVVLAVAARSSAARSASRSDDDAPIRLTTGIHRYEGYSLHVRAPAGDAPVLVLLHGSGGNGRRQMRQWHNSPETRPLFDRYIVVAPSWSTTDASFAERGDLWGRRLRDHLETYANVVPRVSYYGASAGALLTLNVLVQNDDDPRLVRAAIDGTQLRYHAVDDPPGRGVYADDTFVSGSVQKTSLSPVPILQMVSGDDRVIPPAGGLSSKGRFLPWRKSARLLAEATGQGAEPLIVTRRPAYLRETRGDVVAYFMHDVGHVAANRSDVARRLLVDFFE